ncbi:MAG: peptidoglycan-binding protein [Eggerthellaceae bacterium]|nr:peptidoglycan-binding protein [Eggerthellaceae bacterium]
MDTIALGASGPAVEDVQNRLVAAGYLEKDQVTGVFDLPTADAVEAFSRSVHLEPAREVDQKVWAALVDASFSLGDRTLYLKMPYFHGHDVRELQQVLSVLGFASGWQDGIFGAHTEAAVRNFQMNMGLPSDGIAGAYTYRALRNLHHSWEGKEASKIPVSMGFARAADVLESNAICLFGIDEFTRSVAARMSNLAQATNPASKFVSAEALSVEPDSTMVLVEVLVEGSVTTPSIPCVPYTDTDELALRIRTAIDAAAAAHATPIRIGVVLPSRQWIDAGEERSAQHFAITLLDGLCTALAGWRDAC